MRSFRRNGAGEGHPWWRRAAAQQRELIERFIAEHAPMRDEVVAIMEAKPDLRQRKTVAERVIEGIKGSV